MKIKNQPSCKKELACFHRMQLNRTPFTEEPAKSISRVYKEHLSELDC